MERNNQAESVSRPPDFFEARNRRQKARAAGLHPDYWYPVEHAGAVRRGQVVEVMFWNTSIAVFRGDDGRLRALENRCAHRQLKLSLGNVTGCDLACAYHGWTYNEQGRVCRFPHDLFGRPPLKVRVDAYPVRERYGLIWLFPGDPEMAEHRSIPDIPELEGENRWGCVPLDFTWRAHHSMILDNLCDLTHAYLHRHYRFLADHPIFAEPKLVDYAAEGDRVSLAYESKATAGRVSGLFIDRTRSDVNRIDLCYDYPYQRTDTNGTIKNWAFFVPIDERTTRAFFLIYFLPPKIPPTSLRLPHWLMSGFLRLVNRLAIRPVFAQDGVAVEAEQRGYEAHFDAPEIEVNPVVSLFQELTIRKWEEHLSGSGRAVEAAGAR